MAFKNSNETEPSLEQFTNSQMNFIVNIACPFNYLNSPEYRYVARKYFLLQQMHADSYLQFL